MSNNVPPPPPPSPSLQRTTSRTLPLDLFADASSFDSEKDEAAAETLQRFSRKLSRYRARLAKHSSPSFLAALSLLSSSSSAVRSMSFQAASAHLASPPVLSAAQLFLSLWPKDSLLQSLPRDSRSPRAFLSLFMVVHHTASVLNEGGEEEGAGAEEPRRRLLSSCRLALASLNALHSSLSSSSSSSFSSSPSSPSSSSFSSSSPSSSSSPPSSSSPLSYALASNLFAFSRRFLASSLAAWRRIDSEKLAANLISPYSQVFSMLLVSRKEGDSDIEANAVSQLGKMKSAMEALLGISRCGEVLGEIEVSVRETMEVHFAEEEATKEATKEQEAAARTAAVEKKRVREEKVEREKEEEKAKAEFTDRLVKNMSVTNERLCHEIILDPAYKIPGSSQAEEAREEGGEGGAPTGEGDDEEEAAMHPQLLHAKKVEEQMKKVFWNGLTVSLTPPSQSADSDFVLGATVQCKYGSAGSYYSAEIVAAHEAKGANLEPTFDVRFEDDTVVQKGVSGAMFRKAGDPISYTKLLALLQEVKGKLLGIAPKRGGYAEAIEANIDLDLLKQVLENAAGGFSVKAFQNLAAFICRQICEFQAPVRNAKTKRWIGEYLAKVGAHQGSPASLLPELLEWVFLRCDETAKDIANSHIDMLRPQLKENGVDYERKAFKRRLEGKEIELTNVKLLMKETVPYVAELKVDASVNKESVLDKCARREQVGFVGFVAASFLCLMRRGVRLDTPGYESIDGGLPETLLWDAAKLAKARDVADTVTLISTMVVLLRQVLARGGAMGTPDIWLKIQRELLVLVESGGVKMPDLEAFIVMKAKELLPSISDGEVASLKSIIANSAREENAVFKLYSKRCDKLIFDCLKAGTKKEIWGKEGEKLKELICKSGFASFESELRQCLLKLIPVFRHTIGVHMEYYADMSVEAIASWEKGKAMEKEKEKEEKEKEKEKEEKEKQEEVTASK